MTSSRMFKAFVGLILLAATAGAQNGVNSNTGDAASKLTYPAARKGDTSDDYFGTKVADPYRWLEDLDSPETRAWVEAENKLTFDYLGRIPQRAAIKDRLTKLWNYERYSIPSRQGPRYVYAKNNGLQNQSVFYVADTLEGAPRVLIDPNTLSTDGTVALSGMAFTEDGALMAYGLASSGSDWNEWHVRDVATGKDLPDVVNWVKFSGASWTKDGEGFYYSRYDEPKSGNRLAAVNEYHKVYFHLIGTPQSADKVVYSDADPARKGWIYNATVTEDGRYLVINLAPGSAAENRVYYKDISMPPAPITGLSSKPDAPVVKLLDDAGVAQYFVGNDGPVFWFLTDRGAPRKRVVAVDTRAPEQKNWKTVVAEAKDAAEDVNVVGDQLIVSYLTDAHRSVKVFDLDGKLVRDIELPGIGEAVGFNGKRKDKETFYSYRSFTTPATVYRYDIKTGKSTIFRQPKVDFNPSDYETRQVFYTSKDGTRVPMFITSKKGLKLDGQNPTLLYGYGGFDVAETPAFSVSNLVWMEMGGVYALANLRGGSEYGKEWHEAGMLHRKQNVFDDFIAAAEYLISNKYTSTPKLAVYGGSNGGLLVGAVLTQRPDLFGAAVPAVGVMDMLRFPKFTIGAAWQDEYGHPGDVAEDFKYIYAYSPLHTIKPGAKYPATLVTTADHDDRVWPAHSFKFAAALQAAQAGGKPVLIRIETKAGHGAGKPTSKQIEEAADRWAFLVRELGMNLK